MIPKGQIVVYCTYVIPTQPPFSYIHSPNNGIRFGQGACPSPFISQNFKLKMKLIQQYPFYRYFLSLSTEPNTSKSAPVFVSTRMQCQISSLYRPALYFPFNPDLARKWIIVVRKIPRAYLEDVFFERRKSFGIPHNCFYIAHKSKHIMQHHLFLLTRKQKTFLHKLPSV